MGDKTRSWDLILAQSEFAYKNLVNRSTREKKIEIVTGVHPKGIAELRDISSEDQKSSEVEEFADHMSALHI